MRAISRRYRVAIPIAAAAALIAAWLAIAHHAPARTRTGLFTSLPIIWSETASVGAALQSSEAPHWARAAIADGGTLVPLDFLDAKALAPLHEIVIAQPRPLAPLENVALDGWVRGGGRVLLIVDPLLTQESIFPLGDPRRPQATALLSPILTRWGLELEFDDGQPAAPRVAEVLGGPVVVELAGRFAALPGARCRISNVGLVARCRVGKGEVLAFADAAVMGGDDPRGTKRRALIRLLDAAFPPG